MGAESMMGAALIKYTGPVPGVMSKADWNREILKPSYNTLGEVFWKDHLKVRFTREGAKLLNYAPRRGEEPGTTRKEFFKSYTGRKLRSKGHTDPLRWSDDSYKLSRIRDVRATSKGVRVIIHSRGLNRRNPNSKIRMNEEVRRIAPLEYDPLMDVLDDAVERNLAEYNVSKTVKVT